MLLRLRLSVSPCIGVCLLAVLALLTPAASQAQATAPAVSLGTVTVGSTGTATVTFTFSASTTVASVSVVTQGVTGLDFTAGTQTAGACAAGTYGASATCTVVVNFTPAAAGLRLGAVLLLGSSSNKLGVGPVYGSGSGATFETDSTAATLLNSGGAPSQITSDVSGNLYVSSVSTETAYELTPAGVKTNIAGSAAQPGLDQVGVDGAGYIYLFDYDFGSSKLYRTDPVSGTQTVFASSGLTLGSGLAIDPLGNIYLGQGDSTSSGTIVKYSPSGTQLATISVPASALSIVFDPAGNLYYLALGLGLYTIPSGGTTSTLVAAVPCSGYGSLARDAAGNFYSVCTSNGTIYEVPAGSSTVNIYFNNSTGGVGVDANGNLYYGYANNLYKVDRTHPAATLSGATAIGSTSAERTQTYRNIGSAASAISASVASANGRVGPSNTCAANNPVAVNATCVASLEFAPVATGSPQNATLTLTGPLTAPVFTLTAYVAGDPVKLGFTSGPPVTSLSGGNPGTVTVAIQDNSGTTVSGLTDSLTLTITGPSSPTPTTVNAVNGVATFNLSADTLTTVGTYTFTVTDSTRSLTSAATTEAVLPKYFTVVPNSLNLIASTPDSIVVTAYDNAGNQATAYAGYVALTSTDTAATLPAPFSLSSGQATTSVMFGTVGIQTLTATDSATGLVSGTSANITVTADPNFIVNSSAGDTSGACTNQNATGATPDSKCTLYAALQAVTALNNSSVTSYVPTITFAPALTATGPLTITVLQPVSVTGNVSLIGPGAVTNSITLSGGGTVNFLTSSGTAVTNLTGLTFANFSGANSAVLTTGGGTATLTNDVFTGNGSTSSSTNGGALGVTGTLTIAGCTFTNNVSAAGGGALASTPTSMVISNSVFSGNTAATNGGALYSAGTGAVTITNSAFFGNHATGSSADGGALYFSASAPLTITNGTFNSNTARLDGGAIYAPGLYTIANSSFTGNSISGTGNTYGGAMYANSTSSANSISSTNFLGNFNSTTGSGAFGGALYVNHINLTNVLFSGNYVNSTGASYGGAVDVTGTGTWTGATLTGNCTAPPSTATPPVACAGTVTSSLPYGGAVYHASGTDYLYNVTVTGNSAKTGGGWYKSSGSSLIAYNSVISGNTSTTGSNPDVYGTTVNYDSYIGTGTPCSAECTPLLSALGNYGGGTVGATVNGVAYTTPVQTMIPLPGSPLLAAGSLSYVAPTVPASSGGPTTDGRGYPRTLTEAGSSQVDMGAVEANYTLSFVQQPTTVGAGLPLSPAPTIQLLESGVAGGDGVGTDPGSFAGGTLTIAATPDAPSPVAATTTATGLESLSESFTPNATGETLTVTAQSGATTPVTVASAASNTFNIITAGTKTITFTQPASPVLAGSSATLVASASNGDPVTFSITNGTGTATVSGTTISYLTPGTVTVNANSAQTGTTYAAATVSYAVTIQSAPLVFLAGSGSVASLSSTGGVTSSAVTGGGIGVAVDASGTTWSLNSGGGGVSTFTTAAALGTAYTPIGLSGATALAIDGNSKVVIANGNGQTEILSNAGAVVSTTQGSTSAGGSGVAVDLSGNVWVANPSANSVDEIIGGASPAAPLATAVQSATSGTRP